MTQLAVADHGRTVLVVSPDDGRRQALLRILRPVGWRVESAPGWAEAERWLREESAPVVIVERNLPDGDWKALHSRLMQMPFPPKVIVTCRLADERLWAEVLNLGGFDVLAQPFSASEVLRSVNSARSHWDEEWRRGHDGVEELSCRATV